MSAMADNESTDVTSAEIARHLAGCSACRTFDGAMTGRRGNPAIVPVDVGHDAPSRISRLVANADRHGSPDTIRYLLVAAAVSIIALSVPEFWASGTSAKEAHTDRHLGSFSAAYGVLLLVTAIRPARARTALPVAGVLAAAIGITAVTDLIRGKIPLVGETLHIPELLSLVLVWLLARRTAFRQ
jgi:predicted anti-sigma-YlaC factor YlaD